MNLNNFFESFKIKAKVKNIIESSTVTSYEIEVEEGEKISKILRLESDLQLFLKSSKINITINAENQTIAIQTPTKNRKTLYLNDFINSKEFQNASSKTSFIVGEDLQKNVIVADVAKMPHLLIAGATGAGKSVFINNLILSILNKSTPDDTQLILIDPKMVELSIYNNISHLLTPVITEPAEAVNALKWAVDEMEKRYKMLALASVRNIDEYNKINNNKMSKIIIIIDELADLMMTAANDIEDCICRLAQKARAAGIHLILATQRPSIDVITGLIKANIPSRIAFTVSSKIDSRIILDESGAEKLTGKGDLLFSPVGSLQPVRCQSPFISDEDVKKELEKYKCNNIKNILEKKGTKILFNDDIIDPLIKDARPYRDLTAEEIQKIFNIGNGRAKRILYYLRKEV